MGDVLGEGEGMELRGGWTSGWPAHAAGARPRLTALLSALFFGARGAEFESVGRASALGAEAGAALFDLPAALAGDGLGEHGGLVGWGPFCWRHGNGGWGSEGLDCGVAWGV